MKPPVKRPVPARPGFRPWNTNATCVSAETGERYVDKRFAFCIDKALVHAAFKS